MPVLSEIEKPPVSPVTLCVVEIPEVFCSYLKFVILANRIKFQDMCIMILAISGYKKCSIVRIALCRGNR